MVKKKEKELCRGSWMRLAGMSIVAHFGATLSRDITFPAVLSRAFQTVV
jgi:hypothetical protein